MEELQLKEACSTAAESSVCSVFCILYLIWVQMNSPIFQMWRLRLREGKCGQLRNGPHKDQVLSPEPVRFGQDLEKGSLQMLLR